MDKKKIARLILTAIVVLVGGFCIQQFSVGANFSDLAQGVNADYPYATPTK